MPIVKTSFGYRLDTQNTSYLLEIGAGQRLLHTYYGAKIDAQSAAHLISEAFSIPADPIGDGENAYGDLTYMKVLPQEYTSFGGADFRISPIKVRLADGSYTTDFRYRDSVMLDGVPTLPSLPFPYANEGEDVQTLEVSLLDAPSGLVLILGYTVFAQKDVIVRYTKLKNPTEQAVEIERLDAVQLDFCRADLDWIHFYGSWGQERMPERSAVLHGIQGMSSLRGISSHAQAPFVVLCDHTATETAGGAWGIHFMYSGCHETRIEKTVYETVRCNMGIAQDHFSWHLAGGEAFASPAALMTYSDTGLGQMSRNFHRFIRNNICPPQWLDTPRPILINNWEATYFRIDEEKLLRIAKDAASLGIDMLVMDDGWFGHRNNDTSSLGDWFVDTKRFPQGLSHLVAEVNQLGMKFGIWMEPEMVCVDSELFRTHPDYRVAVPGRVPAPFRNQFVLDFTRKEVVDCIYAQMEAVLSCAPIAYLKWDMNRSITDAYSVSLGKERQGEFHHRYMLGVYDLMERITRRFPDLLLENCCSGGGRFDTGMLRYGPQIWTSDDTDAHERVLIQYGTSFGFPVSCMGAHVSAVPNHQTWRTISMDTRAKIAMNGTFGYELDPGRLTEEERAKIPEQCATYRRFAPLVRSGDYYRLCSPFEQGQFSAWAYVGAEKKEILLFAYQSHSHANPQDLYVRLPADLATDYIDEQGAMWSGSTLANAGVRIHFGLGDHLAKMLYFCAKHEI